MANLHLSETTAWLRSLASALRKRSRRATRFASPISAQRLEDRLLLAVLPTGWVDVLNRTIISGWAFDQDVGAASIQVEIDIDSQVNKVTANIPRPDLTTAIGSPNHGFSFAVPALTPGDHTIKVSAIDPVTTNTVLLKQATLTNPAPTGFVDTMNATTIAGWAFDADAGANPINVRVDVNGTTVTTQAANIARGDLTPVVGSPNHGFSISGSFAGKVVEVFALDNPTGTPVMLWSNNIAPRGFVDQANSTSVSGWAQDPNHPTDPIQVRVNIDGSTVATGTANISRSDLTPVIGSPNHGFSINFAAVGPGDHKVEVFGLDSDSLVNPTKLLFTGTVTNPAPAGFIDAASRTGVSGWVYDSDAGATPINVRIDVDGTTVATVPANIARGDLTPVIGSPNHGFFVALSNLATGPHKIEAYGIDAPSGQASKFATSIIDNHLPTGFLDGATLDAISGWAYDPDPNGAAKVRLAIDGVSYNVVTADLARPDLTPVIGSPNHGFSIATPTLSFGSHSVEVFAQDTFTGAEVLLGTKTLVNQAPRGSFDMATSTSVSGWAQDPDQPTTSDEVLLSIDGTIVARGPANINRADLTPVIGSANHGFLITFQGLSPGQHTFQIFATDPKFGLTSLLGTRVVTVA